MIYLMLKELKDFFKNRTTTLFFLFLSFLIGYSFYSAVDLYSKASMAAKNNPLYATGFEPVPGVFVPTFGALFIILSLIAPFVFISTISSEKRYNTIYLAIQYPISFFKFFLSKLISAMLLLIASLLITAFIFLLWKSFGGYIPIIETLLLILGYFLYGLLIISISFFAASVFKESSQASIFAIFLIMFSWFLDFGKEMNILPLINKISYMSITNHLKKFEDGIFSWKTFIYFFSLIFSFLILSYIFFSPIKTTKNKTYIIYLMFFFSLTNFLPLKMQNYDLTESKRNSFSTSINKFLDKIPKITIKIYLEPTDSRAKDYENDFLKKLKLVKNDVKVIYANNKELNSHYGYFRYTIKNKWEETTSNSEEEIFMILSKLSREKIQIESNRSNFKGHPLVTKNFGIKIWIFYLIIIPMINLFLLYRINYKKRSYSEEDI